MKRHWIKVLAVVLIVSAAVAARFLIKDEYLDIHRLNEHKVNLLAFIDRHYLEAVLSFIGIYVGTALFLPGALVLTLAGGMMFGVLPTVLYVNVGATAGAIIAFAISRFVIGSWFQERFKEDLQRFNSEISRHGKNYLITLRLLPIAPFFIVNYCAGLTRIPLGTFIWTTSVGMIPGSLIYAFVGSQLRVLNAPADLFSWKIMLALLLLSLFALLPVLLHHLTVRRR